MHDTPERADEHRQLEAQLREARAQIETLTKDLAIVKLAVPLEEELSDRIDEACKHLAMEDGFTLAGIARLLIDCQRRMASDWEEIGRERRERRALKHRAATDEALARLEQASQAAQQQLAYWWSETGRCPCGARRESPTTHPHVGGCPTIRAGEGRT